LYTPNTPLSLTYHSNEVYKIGVPEQQHRSPEDIQQDLTKAERYKLTAYGMTIGLIISAAVNSGIAFEHADNQDPRAFISLFVVILSILASKSGAMLTEIFTLQGEQIANEARDQDLLVTGHVYKRITDTNI